MTDDIEFEIELLRQRSHGYRFMARVMDNAGGIASGQGNHGLANQCWALGAKLKARQTEYNRKICKLQNPDYPGKRQQHNADCEPERGSDGCVGHI